MNHNHHPRQIAANNPERDFSLPPSASTADNAFKISVPASPCGGSLPNMTTPYSPDRYHFSKSQSQSPARVLPPLSPPHTLRRSVSDLNHSPAKTSSRSSTSSQDFHFSTDLDTPDSKGLRGMNHHQDSSLPPSASTTDNAFKISVPASPCGGSLPNMTTPYFPDRYHFSKSQSNSPARVLPPLPPPHTLRRSVTDLNHSLAKTSSRSSTSSQDFHFSTDLDTPDSKGLKGMNHHQDSSLPPSTSTADNAFKISVPASPCGGSLPNMTTPYSPDHYHFSKSQSNSPARVLPPLPLPHTLRRSVTDLNHSLAKTSSRSSTSSQDFHFSTDLDTPDSKGLKGMNHHQDSSLPPSASTADNAFKISVPASPCGGSLPNMTTPYSPDRYHFSKSQSNSPARVLPPLPPSHTLRRSVTDLNHSPTKTSSRSSTSSQDFHFSTDLDTPDSKGLSRMKDRLRETCKIPPLCRTVSDVYACANSEEESAFPETVYRKIPPLRRCFSEPYKLPSATTDQPFGSTPNPNRFQPAPVVPARAAPVVPATATADPTFLLSLMALYMALSIYPQNMTRLILYATVADVCSGILICMGMEATFYILINWVADKPYPLLSWLALIAGKILFWISEYRNLPFIVYVPVVMVMNTFLLASLVAKITWNVGWGVAYQFVVDNLGILKLLL